FFPSRSTGATATSIRSALALALSVFDVRAVFSRSSSRGRLLELVVSSSLSRAAVSARSADPPRLGLPVARRALGAKLLTLELDASPLARRALAAEQLALALDAPAIAGEGAVGAHHPVTRDEHRDRIRGARSRDGAHRARRPDGSGDFRVRLR